MLKNKKRVLMYCTGGIRCEKASIEVKKKIGDKVPVYQLKGGIHRYLEAFQSDSTISRFLGKNFVFDKRCYQEGNGTIGVCNVCSASFDKIHQDRRCKKCRILILICDTCHAELHTEYWCKTHELYDTRKYFENPEALLNLEKRIKSIEALLNKDENKGRRKRNKRVALKKEVAELQAVYDKAKN